MFENFRVLNTPRLIYFKNPGIITDMQIEKKNSWMPHKPTFFQTYGYNRQTDPAPSIDNTAIECYEVAHSEYTLAFKGKIYILLNVI